MDFEELKQISLDQGKRSEGRELCFGLLSKEPDNHRARLLLARLFYLDGYYPFALRELEHLRGKLKSFTLDKLIGQLGGGYEDLSSKPESTTEHQNQTAEPELVVGSPTASSEEDVVAEIDFEADFTDLLEELEEKK